MPGPEAQQGAQKLPPQGLQQAPDSQVPPSQALAFQARCLLRASRAATLATQDGGQPYASLITPAVLPDGTVLMLLSALARHTRHLSAEPRCAIFVAGEAENLNPQTAPRLTLLGHAARAPEPALRRYWLDRHPYARLYADLADFAIWRMVPEQAHFVAGFGKAFTLPAAIFLPPGAEAAGVAAAGPALFASCGRSLRPLSIQGRPGHWNYLGLDVDGVDMIQDEEVLRIPFDAPAYTVPDAEAAFRRLAGSGS